MKKFIVGMFALCLGLGMISCSSGIGSDPQEIVAKAKAEGANWDEAQWKEAFKGIMKAAAPMFDYAKEMKKKMEEAEKGDDASKIAAVAEIMKESESKLKEFEPIEKAMDEFTKIAEANPTGKKVLEDKAFQEEVKKEFNLPDEIF